MGNDSIKELLLADGWEQVTAADLAEGDYVACLDDLDRWYEGPLIPPIGPEGLWWHEGCGSIKATDVLLRRPAEYQHLEVRFDGAGEEYINVHTAPRQPAFVKKSLITSELLVKEGGICFSLRTKKVDEGTLTKEKPE